MSTIIFYFSGTGNSYAIAKGIADRLGDTIISSIVDKQEVELESYDRIGFVTPVYALFAPPIVTSLVKDIAISNKQVFIVATYAGSRGYAVEELKANIAGKNVIQEFCVRMPGNYLLEYGAQSKFYQNLLFRRAEKAMDKIADAISKEKHTKVVKANLVAICYRASGERMQSEFQARGKGFFAEEHCSQCGICINLCPTGNITISDHKLVWGDNCQQCMACVQWCPNNAINHPNRKASRERYHHPEVTIKQLERNK